MKNKKAILGIMLSMLIATTLIVAFNLAPVRAQEPPIEVWSDYTLDRDITFADDGFIIKADDVILDLNGHTITGSGEGIGVYSGWTYGDEGRSVDGTTVKNGEISNFSKGIYLSQGDNNNITGNIVTNNEYGIWMEYSAHNFLRDNSMAGNRYNFKVDASESSDYFHDIDTSNIVNEKPIYYWVNEHDREIPSDAGYVGIVSSTNITVKDLILTKNGQGVLLALTYNSTVKGIHALDNCEGIVLSGTHWEDIRNNDITGNTLVGGDVGIDLSFSHDTTITGNTLVGGDLGIDLVYSDDNTIAGNTLTNGGGVHLFGSDSNTVTRNYIVNGSGWLGGIYLDDSHANTITGNTLTNNEVGISLVFSEDNTVRGNMIVNTYGWHVFRGGILIAGSYGNHIYYNNLIHNAIQVEGEVYDLERNIWDDGGLYACPVCGAKRPKGNYWSDYRGLDDGSPTQAHNCLGDGIGDTETPHLGVDKYPLMSLWIPIEGDLNLDGIVNILDIATAAVNFGKTDP